MTLSELVYDLRKISRGGQVSDDDPLTDRLISNWVHSTRAQLIAQQHSKKRIISENSISNLGCISTSLVDASTCCNLETGCTIARTDVQVPNFVESDIKKLITRVGNPDVKGQAFQVIPYSRASVVGNGRYTKLYTFAFEFDNYIFVMGSNAEFLKRVAVQGILEDPTQAKNFNTCEGKPCWTMDSEYPISRRHVEALKKMILSTEFRIAVPAPSDVRGDASSKLEINIEK